MADTLTLEGAPRSATGKAKKRLRRAGSIPVHVFGHGMESQSMQAEEKALRHLVHRAGTSGLVKIELDGKSQNVMVRHVQRHPVTGNLVHVDLYRVRMDQKTNI